MKIIIFTLSFCALICIGCKNKVNFPKLQISEYSRDVIQIGADVKTLQTDKLSSFNNSDSVIELIPEIEDKETNLDFSLYHIHGENISSFITTSESFNIIDEFAYNPSQIGIVQIGITNRKVRIAADDKMIERDSLKSIIQLIEVSKSGNFKSISKYESFPRYVETRPSSNTKCGTYIGENNNAKIKLTLKDGTTNSKYHGLLEVNPLVDCIALYNIKDEDFEKGILSFDDEGKMNLKQINDIFIIENVGYAICDIEKSTFRITLTKE